MFPIIQEAGAKLKVSIWRPLTLNLKPFRSFDTMEWALEWFKGIKGVLEASQKTHVNKNEPLFSRAAMFSKVCHEIHFYVAAVFC